MNPLPVLRDGLDELAVINPDTGELCPVRDASDRALAHAAEQLAEHDRFLLDCKRAIAYEMRQRHGVGTVHTGGYDLNVTESTSWPAGATDKALSVLVDRGVISPGDVLRCMPERPRPDARQLRALLGRLMVSDPDAARVLADAATVSPPSLRDIRQVSVDEAAA